MVPALTAAPPLREDHFPDRLHQFVWRNWELANLDRLASVVGARPAQLDAIGRGMGLPPKPQLSPEQLARIYIPVIRQNWHLLPDEQLIGLLGWTPEHYRFTLKEDDFLDVKLGPKPDCEPVRYRTPDAAARARAAAMKRTLQREIGPALPAPADPAFRFIQDLSSTRDPLLRDRPAPSGAVSFESYRIAAADPLIAERCRAWMRNAMGARESDTGRTLRFTLAPEPGQHPEAVDCRVDENGIEIRGGTNAALRQGLYWLQDQMTAAGGPYLPPGTVRRQPRFDPRYLYSHVALYGDPLLEPELNPFPDGYLEKLARVGINGVWMQGLLSHLAPSNTFPEFGARSGERLANLNKLIERAATYGVKILLYINEPRSQRPEFFQNRPQMKGAELQGYHAVCTAQPEVREWIASSLTHVFRQAPQLGGVFTITMSENLTNCFSKFKPETCPRCAKREWWEGPHDVLTAIHKGVRRASRDAEIVSWDWGWRDDQADAIIPKLPRDIKYMSVSEWSIPIERGGVKAQVGEYSMSVVGPGPRAQRHWALAKKAGITYLAKTQFNCTWELSAVPYIPVPFLVARHCANLVRAGVEGLQASWTLGGYPSPNLSVAREFYFTPEDGVDAIVERVAHRRYGPQAAPQVLSAWRQFSAAFEEFPYGVNIYTIPTQHGPANLLRWTPTGVRGTMILLPQDDLQGWCGRYPPEVVASQFRKVAEGWERALPVLRQALAKTPATRHATAREDLAIAEVCGIHFRSVAHQVEFYQLRERGADPGRRLALVREEQRLAARLFALASRHSVLAYEASNHYYYRPADLLEAVIACQWLLDQQGQEIKRNG